jgi:hypothetical protein
MAMIAPWLRQRDCLTECYEDLCWRARTLQPWEGEARQLWTDASRDLLQAVPDQHQRMVWALGLGSAFAPTMPGVPLVLVVGMLLEPES